MAGGRTKPSAGPGMLAKNEVIPRVARLLFFASWFIRDAIGAAKARRC